MLSQAGRSSQLAARLACDWVLFLVLHELLQLLVHCLPLLALLLRLAQVLLQFQDSQPGIVGDLFLLLLRCCDACSEGGILLGGLLGVRLPDSCFVSVGCRHSVSHGAAQRLDLFEQLPLSSLHIADRLFQRLALLRALLEGVAQAISISKLPPKARLHATEASVEFGAEHLLDLVLHLLSLGGLVRLRRAHGPLREGFGG
mmetsp:Transcript_49907/g.121797  ORF Transcript_49907/g.121797 Transcript_49907/m.121797 type:complete len:201 (-) Transcript_49907:776-1378(-)